jgi:hypothetical protein
VLHGVCSKASALQGGCAPRCVCSKVHALQGVCTPRFRQMSSYGFYLLIIFLSRYQSSATRYRIQMLCGYGVPLVVTTLTGIVEATGDQCADFRPRFGEENQCFFSSKLIHIYKTPFYMHQIMVVGRYIFQFQAFP